MERFVPYLLPTLGEDDRLIIADNASTDDSIDWIRKHHPSITIIHNQHNLGFAEGYNRALELVEADYFVLLNSDVEVCAGWLEPLVLAMDGDQRLGACQPKILWEQQRELFEYSGASGGFIDFLGYPFCRGRIFGSLESDHGQYNEPIEVFWASGACMMVRAKLFKDIGGFDGTFFAHMEEIDLCWRIRNAGYHIKCIPSSVVYHVGGATLPKNNAGKTFLNFRNNLTMLWKNLPGSKRIWVIGLRLVLDGVAGIRFMMEGHFKDCWAVVRAHFSFYGRIISGKTTRPKLTITHHPTIYRKSLVWQHFALGKKKFSELDFKRKS